MKAFQKEEDLIQKSREKFQSRILYYEGLADKKLTKIMRNFQEGFEFLFEAIAILIQCSRIDLLRKIWSFAPLSLKKQLNQKAKADFRMTIEELMDESDERDKLRAQAAEFETFGDSEESFDEDFFMGSDFQHKPKTEEIKEDDQIRIKSIFRKIVRRIHPDHLKLEGSEELKSWFDLLWKKVSEAHEKNDLEKLTQLHYKIMVALQDYKELGVSELVTAARLLENEYHDLSQEYSNLRSSPAWNFSRLTDYRKLEKQQSKPFLQQQKRLNEDLAEIKEQRAEIERIAELIREGKIKTGPKRPKRRTPNRPPSRRRRPSRDNFGQMNFGLD